MTWGGGLGGRTVEAPLGVLSDLEALLVLAGVEEVMNDLVVDLQHAELDLKLLVLLVLGDALEQVMAQEGDDAW